MTASMAPQVTKRSCQPPTMANRPPINPASSSPPTKRSKISRASRLATTRRSSQTRRHRRTLRSQEMTRARARIAKTAASRKKVMISNSKLRVAAALIHLCHRARVGLLRQRQMYISHRHPREWPPKNVQKVPSQAVQLQAQLMPRLQSVLWPRLSRTEEDCAAVDGTY